jgi:hypothetical protein
MRLHGLLAALATASAAVILPAAPAFAAAPANDTAGGAVAVTLGFSQTLDTTEATTDADDAQANTDCGAPATDASVWYTYTAAADGGVIVDVSGSDYSAGIIVATGTPGSLALVNCGPGTVGFSAASGETYYVLAFDDQQDGSAANGGTLQISLTEAPPSPSVEVTVDPTGTANKDGTATLTGTYTCTNGDFIDVFGDVTQAVGRFAIHGFFEVFDEGTCDGTTHSWTAIVVPDNGKFAGGKAVSVTFADACGPFECSEGFTQQTVKLRRNGAH